MGFNLGSWSAGVVLTLNWASGCIRPYLIHLGPQELPGVCFPRRQVVGPIWFLCPQCLGHSHLIPVLPAFGRAVQGPVRQSSPKSRGSSPLFFARKNNRTWPNLLATFFYGENDEIRRNCVFFLQKLRSWDCGARMWPFKPFVAWSSPFFQKRYVTEKMSTWNTTIGNAPMKLWVGRRIALQSR